MRGDHDGQAGHGHVLGAWYLGRRERRIRAADWSHLTLAVAAAVALFLAWAVPANLASRGELFRLGIGYHVVEGGAIWLWLRDELAAAEHLYGRPLRVATLAADSGFMGVATREPTEILVLARPP